MPYGCERSPDQFRHNGQSGQRLQRYRDALQAKVIIPCISGRHPATRPSNTTNAATDGATDRDIVWTPQRLAACRYALRQVLNGTPLRHRSNCYLLAMITGPERKSKDGQRARAVGSFETPSQRDCGQPWQKKDGCSLRVSAAAVATIVVRLFCTVLLINPHEGRQELKTGRELDASHSGSS